MRWSCSTPTTSRSDASPDDQPSAAARVLRALRGHRHGRSAERRSCGTSASRPLHRRRLRRRRLAAGLDDVPAAVVTRIGGIALGWLPAVLWCTLIFVLSSQPSLPSPDQVTDKQAHAFTYGVLALFCLM